MTFLAVRHARGYCELLSGSVQAPPVNEHIDKTTEEGKKKKKYREANQKAYSNLNLLCSCKISFEIMAGVTSKDLPDGDVNLAWNSLKQRFDPQISSNKLKLKKKFTNSSLTNWKKDPADWIMELERIRTQLGGMGHAISDEDFMIHIVANLPEEYNSKVESLENDLDS